MGISRSKRRARCLPLPAIGRARKRLPVPIGRGSKRPAIARPSWKLVGLAGIAGVAATGAVVARNRRAHRHLPPDELRDRLRDRLAAVDAQVDAAAPQDAPPTEAQRPGAAP